MPRVLLTGGSGFIATHVLDVLLSRGYYVVTTVRSTSKGDAILAAHPGTPKGKLSYAIVEDIARLDAFDQVVRADPPFDYVLHTASPFHNNFTDPVKELLDPAINGTVGILRAVKAHAPSVKRVVVTSSFAAIANPTSPPKLYDETCWNPVTWDDAVNDRSASYRGSKTFAEKAAWEFVQKEKPGFDLVTMNPPLVLGPVKHALSSLGNLNTSNQRLRDIAQGQWADMTDLPPSLTFLWTDVRDLALAHVRAIEVPEAGGQRFLVTAGYFSNKVLVDMVRETHPELSSKLPKHPVDDMPKAVYGYDNSKTRRILGIQFRPLQESVADTVTSLLNHQDFRLSGVKI